MSTDDAAPAADEDATERLRAWLSEQIDGDRDIDGDVRVEGLDRVDVGHSAEMLTLTVAWRGAEVGGVGGEERRDVVVRLRPPEPGLLEPYDLQRQWDVLRALEDTSVRAPRVLWNEPTGNVLGRPFFVMARAPGEVIERRPVPKAWEDEPGRLHRMCVSMVDQLMAIHRVDLDAVGLGSLGDGATYLDRELDRWEGEMRRVQRGPLPALEALLAELRRRQPEPSPVVTLVHGDVKPGNFAFVGDEVSAVFDWELADLGDPLADVGYLEVMWALPVGITSRPAAMTVDEFVARYEQQTGLAATNRAWYRAMQVYKLCIIQLIASMLFDAGHWDDPRAIELAMGIELMAPMGLRDLGLDASLDLGPIYRAKNG